VVRRKDHNSSKSKTVSDSKRRKIANEDEDRDAEIIKAFEKESTVHRSDETEDSVSFDSLYQTNLPRTSNVSARSSSSSKTKSKKKT